MTACIQFDDSTSDSFSVNSGVKQGCVLAPTLFGIYFAALLRHAFQDTQDGIYIRTRQDGSLYNLARLKAKTRTTEVLIQELLYADDAAIVAHDNETLQQMMNKLSEACKFFSLTISVKKTETLSQGTETPASITLNGEPLKNVDKFTYLGSTISASLNLDDELNSRIGKAATAFSKLGKRAWENKRLTIKTKVMIYQACVLSALLYGSESWTLYSNQEKKLNMFHMRCLRKLLKIKWQDKVTNADVLKRAGTTSMYVTLRNRRLRWLGHVRRMDPQRLPRQILYGELSLGTRPKGRPKLRWKDTCKESLQSFNINVDTLEEATSNRSAWKAAVKSGADKYEITLQENWEDARTRRKERQNQTASKTYLACKYCHRECKSNIGRISHERSCATRRL